jgi:tetratricopeptide (TPR) repeat protein
MDPILFVVGIVMFLTTAGSGRDYKAKKILKQLIGRDDDKNSVIKKIIRYIYEDSGVTQNLNRFNTIKSLNMHFISPVPGKAQSVIGTAVYFLALTFPLIIFFMYTFTGAFFNELFIMAKPDWKEQLRSAESEKDKIDIYKNAAEYYEYELADIDSAIFLYKNALLISDSLNVKDEFYIDLNLTLAKLEDDTAEVRNYLYAAQTISENLFGTYSPQTANIFSYYSKPQFKFLSRTEIESALSKAIQIYNKENDLVNESYTTWNLANLLMSSGSIAEAEELLSNSLNNFDIKVVLFDDAYTGAHLLADLYSDTGRDSMAVALLEEYERQYKKFSDGQMLLTHGDLLSHRGWIYLRQDKIPETRKTFEEALTIYDTVSLPFDLMYFARENILDLCYLEIFENNPEKARKVFEKIEDDLSADYINFLDQENKYLKEYYSREISQEWREKRKEAHMKVLNFLIERD